MQAHRRIFWRKAGKVSWNEAWFEGGVGVVVGDGESLICCGEEAKGERTEADVVFPAYSVPPEDYYIMGQRALSRLPLEKRAALREGHLF
jgi:hypothetical protein